MQAIKEVIKTKDPTTLGKVELVKAAENLAEEISVIIGENQFRSSQIVIETNHQIGETIINHPFYAKGKHGNGELIEQLAMRINKSEQHLYFCIQFVEKFPQVSNALETLQPDMKNLTWRQVVNSLSGNEGDGETSACAHANTVEIKFTQCRKCGARVKDHGNGRHHD